MKTPETFSELSAHVSCFLPNASFGEDLDGQILIYTNLKTADAPGGQTVLVDMDTEEDDWKDCATPWSK